MRQRGHACNEQLNEFLIQLQHGWFVNRKGVEVFFCGFGDSAFNLGMQCIQSCYHKLRHGAELDDARLKCNAAMRATRIPIEINYKMVSNIF
jgi:hypothetical protein